MKTYGLAVVLLGLVLGSCASQRRGGCCTAVPHASPHAPIAWEGITGFYPPKPDERQWILLQSDGRAAMEDRWSSGNSRWFLYHGAWEWRGTALRIQFDKLYAGKHKARRANAPKPPLSPAQTVDVVVMGRLQGELWKFERMDDPAFFAVDGLWQEKRPEYRNPPHLLQFFAER